MIADLMGKAGHMRTVLVPSWVKAAIDGWKEASDITKGVIRRSINKASRVSAIQRTSPTFQIETSDPG